MRKKGTFLLLLCFFGFIGWGDFGVAWANDEIDESYDNPGASNQLNNPDTQQVPLDGGLALLLAAGAGYGLKKYRTATRQNTKAVQNGND